MKVEFGFLTDLHHTDIVDAWWEMWGGEWRVYSTALTRLQAALGYWYAEGLLLAVITGDIINAGVDIKTHIELLAEIMVVINASDFVTNGGRVMFMPGNHETFYFGTSVENLYGWDEWWDELNTGDGHVTAENPLTPAAETGVTDYTYDFEGFRFIALNDVVSDEQAEWYNDRINADNCTPIIALRHNDFDRPLTNAPTVRNIQLVLHGHDHRGLDYVIDRDAGVFMGRGSVRADHASPWTSADDAYYKISVKANAVKGVTNALPNIEVVGQELGVTHNKSFDSYFTGV